MPFDHQSPDEHSGDLPGDRSVLTEDTAAPGTPVVVRRHAGVAALVGAAASAVAIAYLWRASQTMAVLDWTLFGVMALVAAYFLTALVDARTPLLVADDLGVRIRLGQEWRGLPWEAIGQVVVQPRQGLLRDGRLILVPVSLARALEGLEAKSRRHVAANQKMYGAALAVPIGTTTRVSAAGELTSDLGALTAGRTEVVEVLPEQPEGEKAEGGNAEKAAAREDKARARKAARDERARERQAARDERTREREAAREKAAREKAARAEEAAAAKVTTDADSSDEHTDHGATGPSTVEARDRRDDSSAGLGIFRDRSSDPSGDEDSSEVESATAHPDTPEEEQAPAAERAPRRSLLTLLGTLVSRIGKGRDHDIDGGEPSEQAEDQPAAPAAPNAPLPPPVALRETRPALRAEATIDLPTAGAAALDPAHADTAARHGLPEGRELRRPGSVDLVFEPVRVDDRVRPIATFGEPVAPLVIDDYVTEPAYDPVIGPELAAARTRLGLSVDDLADRTRIRPHVIESIEVDDFAPCGGDFYARGHLRTLARVLGKDPKPLLDTFEERYATAPINARRVFEAELATGMTGSMRSTVGGPNWGLLVGVVLTLVLVWGVVRLFTADTDMVEVPAPVLNGSAGIAPRDVAPMPQAPAAVEPVAVRLTASQTDSAVIVRDGEGRIVFSGELVLGERMTLEVAPPVRIRAADGGAVEVQVAGRDKGPLGELGEPARRTFR